MNDPNARYRLLFAGDTQYYTSLLPAMERRKNILATGAYADTITIEERNGDGWAFYDAERFLEGLSRLLAPAR